MKDKFMRTVYGHIEPYSTFYLDRDHQHSIYAEQCGNAKAPAIVVLHGGPGGGGNPTLRRFFNPRKWRIVLFDQRGSGRSRPQSSLDGNTTWALVDDIEHLRQRLGIERWTVFGGSWGAALANAYAQAHPERVDGLILRAVFLSSGAEIDWFYKGGAGSMLPEAWSEFLAHLAPEQRDDPVRHYYTRLTDEDVQVRHRAARSWTAWETAAIRMRERRLSPMARFGGSATNQPEIAPATEALARIECHYCFHRGFMETETQLLDNAPVIGDRPVHIVQGRKDLVTPPITAWKLAEALPNAKLNLIENAGHSAADPAIIDALIRATDAMADHMLAG